MPLKETLTRLAKVAQHKADPGILIHQWRMAVEGLYKIVSRNLNAHVRSGLIILNESSIERFEEALGRYDIPELHLTAGTEELIFTPIAAQIIGGRGRVDLYRRGYASNRYIFIWNGKAVHAAGWEVFPQNRPNESRPYSKELLEKILDELLR